MNLHLQAHEICFGIALALILICVTFQFMYQLDHKCFEHLISHNFFPYLLCCKQFLEYVSAMILITSYLLKKCCFVFNSVSFLYFPLYIFCFHLIHYCFLSFYCLLSFFHKQLFINNCFKFFIISLF